MSHGNCFLALLLAALRALWSCKTHLPSPGDMLLTPVSTRCLSALWPCPFLLLPLSTPSPVLPLSSSQTDGVACCPRCTVEKDHADPCCLTVVGCYCPSVMKDGMRRPARLCPRCPENPGSCLHISPQQSGTAWFTPVLSRARSMFWPRLECPTSSSEEQFGR